jgi:prophage tail gpP-like protein
MAGLNPPYKTQPSQTIPMINPDRALERANARDAQAAATGGGDVTLRIRGRLFTGWLQSDVERSIETIAGTFSVPISYDWRKPPPVARQDEVQVLIGGVVVITGYVLGAEPFYKANDVGLRIVGRDRAGDAVKCSALHKGGQWRNVRIDTIIRDLFAPYGIRVTVDADVGDKIADFKLAHGEPMLDAASRAARLRGCLVMSDGAGNVAITQAGKRLSPGRIVGGWLYANDFGGGNVIEMQGQGTDENRHSSYTAFGQSKASSQADFETARQLKAQAKDPEIKRHTPLVINADGSTSTKDLQTLVDHTARVRRGQAYAYHYKIEGWTVGKTGQPWQINDRVAVYDDVAGYNGGELLIVSTKFSCDLKEGRVTDMVLKPVDAYTQAPLKSKQKKGWAGGKAPKGAKSK